MYQQVLKGLLTFSCPIIAIESTQTLGKIQLNQIPKTIRDDANSAIYNLLGCVIYEGAGNIPVNTVGHYQAVAYRNRRKLIVYDDLKDKSKEIRNTCPVLPAIVIYVRYVD